MKKMSRINSIWRSKMLWVMILLVVGIVCLSPEATAWTPLVTQPLCYQESTNVSDSVNGNCGLNYSGNSIFSGAAFHGNGFNIIDANFSSYAGPTLPTEHILTQNYTKPQMSYNLTGTLWNVKYGNETFTNNTNLTIPVDCIYYSTKEISLIEKIEWTPGNSASTYVMYLCYNGTAYKQLVNHTGQVRLYEDGIFWNATSLIENNQTFNNPVLEGSNQTFILNISYDKTLYTSSSASLLYNGTTYTGVKTDDLSGVIFQSYVDIPLISSAQENKSFYWIIYLTNNTGTLNTFNSTFNNQTINQLLLDNCTTYKTKIVNYSIYNETALSRVVANLKGTFKYYTGDGTIYRNISTDLTGSSSYALCSNVNETYNVEASIELSATGFYDRTYSLSSSPYTNITTNKSLYLVDRALGSNVIIEFRDSKLLPLSGYFVEIYRKYDSLGTDLLVHTDKTDSFGQITANLVENTAKYKFKFYDSDFDLEKSTSEYSIITCRSTVCVITFINEDSVSVIDYNNLTNFVYSLTFNNATNTFIYSWNDNTGETSPHYRLIVTKNMFSNNSIMCNTTSTALIGSLSCAVGGNYSSYSAQAYRYASPERRIGILNIQVGDITGKFGKEGIFWSFFLLMLMITIGVWYPPVGVGLYIVGFIILKLIGVIYAPPEVVIAEIAIGVAFIWAFRG